MPRGRSTRRCLGKNLGRPFLEVLTYAGRVDGIERAVVKLELAHVTNVPGDVRNSWLRLWMVFSDQSSPSAR